VLGDLGNFEQGEVEEKIKWGIDMLAGEEERRVTLIDNDSWRLQSVGKTSRRSWLGRKGLAGNGRRGGRQVCLGRQWES